MERGWGATRKEDVFGEDFGGGAVVLHSLSDMCAVERDMVAEGTGSELALDVPKGLLVESSW